MLMILDSNYCILLYIVPLFQDNMTTHKHKSFLQALACIKLLPNQNKSLLPNDVNLIPQSLLVTFYITFLQLHWQSLFFSHLE